MEILEEILRSLPDGEVQDVRIGKHWTAVVAESNGVQRCGLASNPIKDLDLAAADRDEYLAIRQQRSALELSKLALRHGSFVASVGMAAINALLPSELETFIEFNAGAAIARYGRGKRVALVGHFPFVDELHERVGELNILELNPRPGDLHASEADRVIPQSEVVALTSMTFINGSIEHLLSLCSPGAFVIVLGPSTPLTPRLYEHGIDVLCGSVIDKITPVLEGVEAGEHFRQIQRRGVRLVTMAHDPALLSHPTNPPGHNG
ncbi:MAG: DUF364 domain-containing protein [Anaerolineales bacterium]|nr:DUF364 domain-containing protein [Anaerolineales bacterium]